MECSPGTNTDTDVPVARLGNPSLVTGVDVVYTVPPSPSPLAPLPVDSPPAAPSSEGRREGAIDADGV